MNYCIISDFFQEEVARGAELCNSALIELLRKDHKITTRRSHTITPEFIRDNNYSWIVSNFINLSEESKKAFAEKEYIVYEHDAKWLKSRDFGLYDDFVPPADQIINREFYEKASKVVMQSKVHEYAIKQALGLTNTVCSNGNAWSATDLALLRQLNRVPKTEEYAVLANGHASKGTAQAVKFCQENGSQYKIIPELPRAAFLTELAKFRFLVFFPQVFESYGRIAAEAAALGVSLITNDRLAFRYEEHATWRGLDLIGYMEKNNQEIVKLFQ